MGGTSSAVTPQCSVTPEFGLAFGHICPTWYFNKAQSFKQGLLVTVVCLSGLLVVGCIFSAGKDVRKICWTLCQFACIHPALHAYILQLMARASAG